MRLVSLLTFGSLLAAQPAAPFRDDLLDQLVGVWTLTGELRGQPIREATFAQWMIGHQFLMIHRKQTDGPRESFMYIGYDKVSERYVAHLLDTNGARGSETLGYGLRNGDKIQFVFEYPSGPFHLTMSWDAKEKTWQFVLESKDRQGKWNPVATETLRHSAGRGSPQ